MYELSHLGEETYTLKLVYLKYKEGHSHTFALHDILTCQLLHFCVFIRCRSARLHSGFPLQVTRLLNSPSLRRK